MDVNNNSRYTDTPLSIRARPATQQQQQQHQWQQR